MGEKWKFLDVEKEQVKENTGDVCLCSIDQRADMLYVRPVIYCMDVFSGEKKKYKGTPAFFDDDCCDGHLYGL